MISNTTRNVKRLVITAIVTVAILAAGPAAYMGGYVPTAHAATVTSVKTVSVGSMYMSSWEWEVVRLVNVERQKAGLKPLSVSSELSRVARFKSADMRDRHYFSHTSPTYGSPFTMMRNFGISYRTAGENIAAGQRSPQEVMTAWMNSSGHRANILNRNFTKIGVGLVTGGSYGNYWTEMFVG